MTGVTQLALALLVTAAQLKFWKKSRELERRAADSRDTMIRLRASASQWGVMAIYG